MKYFTTISWKDDKPRVIETAQEIFYIPTKQHFILNKRNVYDCNDEWLQIISLNGEDSTGWINAQTLENNYIECSLEKFLKMKAFT